MSEKRPSEIIETVGATTELAGRSIGEAIYVIGQILDSIVDRIDALERQVEELRS